MGTPDIAATVLERLVRAFPGAVVGVLSQPDRPKGRDLQMQPTPVKVTAMAHELPVWQPEKARSPETLERLRELAPDLIVVVAYGQLLPQALLEIPRRGCLNIHTSLLPRWRGAAPIQWAMATGDAQTGVTLMRMDAGLDTGPILATRTTEIRDDDTGQTLHDRLGTLGADLLVESWEPILAGTLLPVSQPSEGVTYARKITKEDGWVDWTLAAPVIWRRMRAFTPWPGTTSHWPLTPKAKRIKLHAGFPVEKQGRPGQVIAADPAGIVVACGSGALCVTQLQPEGGRSMSAGEFLAGHAHLVGLQLS